MLANRVSFALLIIGLLIACAVILSAHPAHWLRYLAIGGLALDGLFIIALLSAMWRAGRL